MPFLMCRHFDEAIRVMQRATTTPKNTKISFHDDVSRVTLRSFGVLIYSS